MRFIKLCFFVAMALLGTQKCLAQISPPDPITLFSQLTGYQIVGVGTVTGFVEGSRRGNEFEGCIYGRQIIIDGGSFVVRCSETSAQLVFSMQPKVVIFTNGMQMRALVDGFLYRVER